LGFFTSTNCELAPDWHRGYLSTFSIASAARVSVLSFGQDTLVGGIEQAGKLGLGIFPGAFNGLVSDPALAGYCIRLAVEFEPPRMFAASGDVASQLFAPLDVALQSVTRRLYLFV
jgi:hypothetical protein